MDANKIFLMVMSLALSGCASMYDQFKEPVSGPTASIRYVAATALSGNVFIMEVVGSTECGGSISSSNTRHIAVLHGIAAIHKRKTLGMPLNDGLDEKNFTEIKLPSGVIHSFDMHQLTTGFGGLNLSGGTYSVTFKSCNITSEFTPEAGRNYEATFAVDPSQGSCSVSVVELFPLGDGKQVRVAEKTAQKRETQCKWK